MSKLVARGYITEVVIIALTYFFSLPLVTEDIYMIFDATVSGINSLWDLKCMLPLMGSFIMMVGPKTQMVDLDVGEMFYNFRLSLVLENYYRVGLGSYLGHKKDQQVTCLWMRLVHLMMGLVLSQYAAMQGILWAIGVVRGYRSDPYNPFIWDKIRLNLPGEPNYSPTIPWV